MELKEKESLLDLEEKDSLMDLWSLVFDNLNLDSIDGRSSFASHCKEERNEKGTDEDLKRLELAETMILSFVREDPDHLILRFLRARKKKLEKAFEMVMGCLEWRWKRNVKLVMMKGEGCVHRASLESGKIFPFNLDKKGNLVS